MSTIRGIDRHGRGWNLVPIDGELHALLVDGDHQPAALAADELINSYGPLTLVPNDYRMSQAGREVFLDVIDRVASDPETATIEQITAVAMWARTLLRSSAERTR